MSPLVPLVMFGWIPVVLAIFVRRPPQQAVLIAFMGAWLLLPEAEYALSGVPDYTKMSATCVGILAACLIFDGKRMRELALKPYDIPMISWCLCPLLSSISNELGLYDGLAQSLNQTFTWGLPYLIGRLYFTDPVSLRTLAYAIVIGGLFYVPLCLIEIRISPQLHRMVYGFHQHQFAQSIRGNGFRPTVFMEHGLMVGMWMATSSLLAFWLWFMQGLRRLSIPRFGSASFGGPLLLLLITTVLCKSYGALALLVLGIGSLVASYSLRTRSILIVLLLLPPIYCVTRSIGVFDGQGLVVAAAGVDLERAESLAFRLSNEDLLMDKALQRPLFGWGGWGRARVYDWQGDDVSTADGQWIIALGDRGMFGLVMFLCAILTPAIRTLAHSPATRWKEAGIGAGVGLAMVLILYATDSLLNAMKNPVFMLIAGALNSSAHTLSSRAVSQPATQAEKHIHRLPPQGV
jgi:hypothetical protein